jgi:hypothetical protein
MDTLSKDLTPALDTSKKAVATIQAGGGVPIITSPEARRVSEFTTTVASYAKNIYEGVIAKTGDNKTTEAVKALWLKEQGEQEAEKPSKAGEAPKPDDGLSFREFITLLEAADALADIEGEAHDFTRPLSNYYISSSHNTYLMGNQLYGEATTNGYKNVLLRGCRCVEIDVWDGEESDASSISSSDEEAAQKPKLERSASKRAKWKKRLGFDKAKAKVDKVKGVNVPMPSTPDADDTENKTEDFLKPERWRSSGSRVEPVVLHGYTATKEIPFRAVCLAIGKYAFKASPLPVIVSLEVHTSIEQQKLMVEIMHESFGNALFTLPDAAEDVALPAPQDLLNKILIKVKYSPPKQEPHGKQPPDTAAGDAGRKMSTRGEVVDSESGSETEVTKQDSKGDAAPASKMYEALSRLGVYTRSFHFSNFEQPEAKIPTHIFSLSENKFKSVHEKDVSGLSQHNRNFLMRCYPKGLRIQSSNLDPAIFWRHGVQMVALNWQHWDAGTMMNEAMFAGSGGYVLKPLGYRGDAAAAPDSKDAAANAFKPTRCTINLTIEYYAGQNIPLPHGETKAKGFHPYVKTELHVETPEERRSDAKLATTPAGGAKSKDGAYRQRTKAAKGRDPDFHRESAEFKEISGVVPQLSFVR